MRNPMAWELVVSYNCTVQVGTLYLALSTWANEARHIPWPEYMHRTTSK